MKILKERMLGDKNPMWKDGRSKERDYQRKYYAKNKDKARAKLNKWRKKVRLEVLKHYGGNPPKCACCGEAHIEFLAIDHIGGGGNKQRKTISGSDLPRWLKKNNYPKGYQVLCHNCNFCYGCYDYCPHQKK